MKKINLLLGSLMLTATSVLTSCFSNDIPQIVITGGGGSGTSQKDSITITEKDVQPSENYFFLVRTNVSAKVTVDGKSIGNNGTLAKGSAKPGTSLIIVAVPTNTDYKPESVTKQVSLDANGMVIEFTFAKDPVVVTGKATSPAHTYYSIPVSDAQDKTDPSSSKYESDPIYVVNSVANQRETSTVATMTVSHDVAAATAASSGVKISDLFSVSTKIPVLTDVVQNFENVQEQWFPVMVVDCKPDGAQFGSKPANVELKNFDFDKDMKFSCDEAVSGASIQDPKKDGYLNVQFDHFSDKTIKSKVSVVKRTQVEEERISSILDVKVGNGVTYEYFLYSGWTSDFSGNAFIKRYLDAKFGPYRYGSIGQVKITNDSYRASVPYSVVQKVYYYDVTFGDLQITVKVYGEDSFELRYDQAVKYDPIKHSGGAAY